MAEKQAKAWNSGVRYLYWEKAVPYLLSLKIKSGEEYLKRVWDASSIYAAEQYTQASFGDKISIKVCAQGEPKIDTCELRLCFSAGADKSIVNLLRADLIANFGYPSFEGSTKNDHIFVWQLEPTRWLRIRIFLKNSFDYFRR